MPIPIQVIGMHFLNPPVIMSLIEVVRHVACHMPHRDATLLPFKLPPFPPHTPFPPYPLQVIGMHFMNPPVIMSLVEVVLGLATSDHTLHLTKGLAHRFGKAVCEARDYPGFIVNRLLMPMINEAFYALLEGVGTAQDIDRGMKLGTNQAFYALLEGVGTAQDIDRGMKLGTNQVDHTNEGIDLFMPPPRLSLLMTMINGPSMRSKKMLALAFYMLCWKGRLGMGHDIDKGIELGTKQPMGPLHLADLIGLDTCVAIMRVLHAGLGDAKYRPCPLLVQYVDAGWLGRKSGRGVYEYPKQEEGKREGEVEGEGGGKTGWALALVLHAGQTEEVRRRGQWETADGLMGWALALMPHAGGECRQVLGGRGCGCRKAGQVVDELSASQ
ncbi:unnamed protein product [Closterium sp. NIES-64]|nr:unnamed protein product [Closterium sp. NIES-64]